MLRLKSSGFQNFYSRGILRRDKEIPFFISIKGVLDGKTDNSFRFRIIEP
jgi:hypothetical protein